MEESVFPNPLQITFGSGRILVSRFMSDFWRGLMFSDTGQDHEVGSVPDIPTRHDWEPQPGEVYLTFLNIESARAVAKSLQEVIDEWPIDSGKPFRV